MLPLAFPGVAAGSVFTFSLTLGDYIIPGVVGAPGYFIGMIVYHRLLHEIFRVPPHCSPEDAVAGYVGVFLDGLRPRSSTAKRNARRP